MTTTTNRLFGLLLLLIMCSTTAVYAQLEYRVQLQGSASSGDYEPLWLNANKYGLSSLKKGNGYLRAGVFHPVEEKPTDRRVHFGYGADVAVAAGFTSTFVVQQAYAEARWLIFDALVGSKELPMEMKNQQLSTGSQTLGINARPIPQVRAGIHDYWPVPLTRGWLSIKGHVAYGMTTDDGWQRDFTHSQSRRTEHALFHSKMAAVRIGPKNITFELGLEMASQFGGTSYQDDGTVIHNSHNLKAFFHALTASGSDATDGRYLNASGNHVGSWLARLNIDQPSWKLGVYWDQYFEDNSMMVHVAYNGWGTGEKAFQHVDKRYFGYAFKDGLWGAELQLKRVPWLNTIVVEHMATKYQGGPTYHDVTRTFSEHITGRDNYYNHHLFNSWQHWGQVIGNPLYRSPLYNTDGRIFVMDNRFVAWHLGISGQPLPSLDYRVLATWQRGYGTYDMMFPEPQTNTSLLAEVNYKLNSRAPLLQGCSVKAAVGLDHGKLLGNNVGFQITLTKQGLLTKK